MPHRDPTTGRFVGRGVGLDIYPQWLRAKITESAANTYTEKEFQTPVIRGIGSASWVMNILLVMFFPSDGALATADEVDMHLSTKTKTIMSTIGTTGIIAPFHSKMIVTTSGSYQIEYPHRSMVRLDDGAGHGLLVANQTLFVAVKGTSQGAALTGEVGILYNLKQVSIDEYLGIIDN